MQPRSPGQSSDGQALEELPQMVDGLELRAVPFEELEVRILRLEPGDVLAVRTLRRITREQADAIVAGVRASLGPDFPVLVLPPELELLVVRQED